MYDWTAASAKCFEEDAHLLSVNNYGEDDILTQNKTWELFGAENVLTSGISLRLSTTLSWSHMTSSLL